MDAIQQNSLNFYLPLIAAYALASGITLILFRFWKHKEPPKYTPRKKWLELFLSLGVVMAVLLVGQLYREGYLIPSGLGPLAWVGNNLIIFSPVFIAVLARKQPLTTLWLSAKGLQKKLVVGLIASFIALFAFLVLRGELSRFPGIIQEAFTLDSLSNFVAVFLEGVALAYLFIRIKWVSNLKTALAIPSLLFAYSHFPRMLADGDPWYHILFMSIVTATVAVFVLYTCNRTKDIIWIGLVHYFMDVAIQAFI